MRLQIKKFGTTLLSRPAGREAALAALAYSIPKDVDTLELDFEGINVLTPSWMDEFLQTITDRIGKDHFSFVSTENPSVKLTLETIQE